VKVLPGFSGAFKPLLPRSRSIGVRKKLRNLARAHHAKNRRSLALILVVENPRFYGQIPLHSDYLDDDSIPLEDRGTPWKDVAEAAGVTLLKTQKFKPLGVREISSTRIRIRCRDEEDIINTVYEEEKELPQPIANTRYDFCVKQRATRPTSSK